MRILVVGSDSNAYTLAKYFSNLERVDIVFVAPGLYGAGDFYTPIDISASNVDELLEFVRANEINLTVVASEDAVANSIADVFGKEKLPIFAPLADSARIALSKASAKKTLYKLRIQTPKFGIFDRENMAIDYVRKSKYPIVIKRDNHVKVEPPLLCNTFSKAKLTVEKLFESNAKKILVEDFVDAKEVAFYVITDGYTALPIGRVSSMKGTSKYSVYSPDFYLSSDVESKLMKRVVYPIIDEIAKHSSPYVGILGFDVLLSGQNFQILEVNSFFNEVHFQAMLPLIKDDLLDLMFASISGSLSDDYSAVTFNDEVAYSVKVQNSDVQDVDLSDFDVSSAQGYKILTTSGRVLTSAVKNMRDSFEFANICDNFVEELSSIVEDSIYD